MSLKNLFKKNKKSTVSLLNQDEKILFIETFFAKRNIGNIDFADLNFEGHKSILGTPQYTLVLYLDFIYVFLMDEEFRESHIESAQKSGISLSNFELTPESLMKLAEYYTSYRNLSPDELKEVRELWHGQINDQIKHQVYTFSDAMVYWCESVVRALQVIDLMELGKAQGILETEDYLQKVEFNLALNKPILESYMSMREEVS